MLKVCAVFAVVTCCSIVSASAQEAKRTELKRSDLTGTTMEVILSITVVQPGELIARHSHHGEEAAYVLEGATVELPDGKQLKLESGSASINVRDVAHAGFKVVGDKALKLYTVHVVDKGKLLYEPAK